MRGGQPGHISGHRHEAADILHLRIGVIEANRLHRGTGRPIGGGTCATTKGDDLFWFGHLLVSLFENGKHLQRDSAAEQKHVSLLGHGTEPHPCTPHRSKSPGAAIDAVRSTVQAPSPKGKIHKDFARAQCTNLDTVVFCATVISPLPQAGATRRLDDRQFHRK